MLFRSRNTRPSAASPSIVPRLDLGTLAKSPFADDSSEVDDVADSAKKETGDSTEVETETSESEDVAQAQTETIENEKNQQ